MDLQSMAPPYGHYTHRVMALAMRLVVEDGLPYRSASWTLWRDHRVFVPFATIQNWVEAAGQKKPTARRARIPLRRVRPVLRGPRHRWTTPWPLLPFESRRQPHLPAAGLPRARPCATAHGP